MTSHRRQADGRASRLGAADGVSLALIIPIKDHSPSANSRPCARPPPPANCTNIRGCCTSTRPGLVTYRSTSAEQVVFFWHYTSGAACRGLLHDFAASRHRNRQDHRYRPRHMAGGDAIPAALPGEQELARATPTRRRRVPRIGLSGCASRPRATSCGWGCCWIKTNPGIVAGASLLPAAPAAYATCCRLGWRAQAGSQSPCAASRSSTRCQIWSRSSSAAVCGSIIAAW